MFISTYIHIYEICFEMSKIMTSCSLNYFRLKAILFSCMDLNFASSIYWLFTNRCYCLKTYIQIMISEFSDLILISWHDDIISELYYSSQSSSFGCFLMSSGRVQNLELLHSDVRPLNPPPPQPHPKERFSCPAWYRKMQVSAVVNWMSWEVMHKHRQTRMRAGKE